MTSESTLLYKPDEFAGVDILINIAAVIEKKMAKWRETDEEIFDKMIGVNIKGLFSDMAKAERITKDVIRKVEQEMPHGKASGAMGIRQNDRLFST